MFFCPDCLPKRLESCQNIATEPQAYTVENQPDQAYFYPSESEAIENTTTLCSREGTVSSPVDNVSTPELPSFAPTNPYNQFKWGEIDGEKIAADIDSIYTQIVHWKHNLFKVPSGKYGKVFVQELACLFNAYGEATAIEGVALKAAMIFPALVLQNLLNRPKAEIMSHVLKGE